MTAGRQWLVAVLALGAASLGGWPGLVADAAGREAPHERGDPWLDPGSGAFHGVSDLSCGDCHEPARDCQRCHFGDGGARVPPRTGWRHGSREHRQLRGQGSVCNACHQLARRYGYGPGGCHDCHGDGDDHDGDDHGRRRGGRYGDDDDGYRRHRSGDDD